MRCGRLFGSCALVTDGNNLRWLRAKGKRRGLHDTTAEDGANSKDLYFPRSRVLPARDVTTLKVRAFVGADGRFENR